MAVMEHEKLDADDVRKTLDGNPEAFGRLFDRHARGVRAVVAAVSRDFAAVEDLTQETFLRAYERISTLRVPQGFRKWIHGIARLVGKERRKELHANRLQFETNQDQLESQGEATDLVERDEEQRLVLLALAGLSERERLAIHAYYFHDQNADQAAEVIGLSRSGFYAALGRGMKRLRQQLGVSVEPPLTKGKSDDEKTPQ